MSNLRVGSRCVFCRIAAGVAPARVVHEDEATVSFLDTSPAAPGHTLVVPRIHVVTLDEADPATAGSVMATASVVARLLRDRLAPDGLTLVQTNGRAGWQDVDHLHVHLVPRWAGDDLVPPWTPRRAADGHLDEVLAQLS